MDVISRTFSLRNKTLPTVKVLKRYIAIRPPMETKRLFTVHKIRDGYTDRSFCILSQDFIQAIARMVSALKVTKIAELCCGGGWLSYWLKQYGIHSRTVDNKSWQKASPCLVTKCDAAEYVREHLSVQLFILSWPDYGSDVAYRVWRSMKRGQYLLFIGEDKGGCTANDAFFKAVRYEEIPDIWGLRESFISFWGIHDHPTLYWK